MAGPRFSTVLWWNFVAAAFPLCSVSCLGGVGVKLCGDAHQATRIAGEKLNRGGTGANPVEFQVLRC